MFLTKPITAVVLTSALALSACTSVESDASNSRRAKEGAVIGALGGAVVGALTGKSNKSRRKGAIVGALVGGTAGGVVGNNLDKQAAELQSELSDNRIGIENTGDTLVVNLPQDILFAVDSATVNSGLHSDLVALASNLQRYPDSTVVVTGHTDNTGSAEYNQDLSQRRAGAVVNVLSGSGVSYSRLRAVGAGEDQPIASNLTDAGRALNRRVEIVIRPNS